MEHLKEINHVVYQLECKKIILKRALLKLITRMWTGFNELRRQ
jgi:hypothetical protein